jgi:hypothetical protein
MAIKILIFFLVVVYSWTVDVDVGIFLFLILNSTDFKKLCVQMGLEFFQMNEFFETSNFF